MRRYTEAYGQFVKWVQDDMKRERVMINRKVFSVVLWCLILPAVLSLVLYGLRKFQIVQLIRYFDAILFLPPFLYAIFSLWPTLRDLPRVFRIGGLGALLEESLREVEWRENTSFRLQNEVKLTYREWNLIEFHLEQDIRRLRAQNRYMTVLAAVVLFFMYQFLDLGGGVEIIPERGPIGVFSIWVEQFSQWGAQVLAIGLFTSLFYLSGTQLQKHLVRYQTCVKRLSHRIEDPDQE